SNLAFLPWRQPFPSRQGPRTLRSFIPPLLKIYDRGERLRIQAGPAHQRAVQLFLGHQPLNIVGLDASAVQNLHGLGRWLRKTLGRADAQVTMGIRGNFRSRRLARANRPNWLVCQQNTGELRWGQRTRSAVKLAL